MKVNIAVVEDFKIDSEILISGIRNFFADKHGFLENITSYSTGEEILEDFKPEIFNIVFMDIIMGAINGIETARKLRSFDSKLLIIFMTTSSEFALSAFPTHPFDYIIKPYSEIILNKVLDDALNFLNCYDEPLINIRASRSEYRIPLRKINSVLSNDHTTKVNMSDGKCLSTSMTFSEIEEKLNAFPSFLYCNRGIIINMDNVSSLNKREGVFIMNDGAVFPIKVRGQSKIISDFSQYQISRMRGGLV